MTEVRGQKSEGQQEDCAPSAERVRSDAAASEGLILNLKTAKALGLTIPRTLLIQAGEMIH